MSFCAHFPSTCTTAQLRSALESTILLQDHLGQPRFWRDRILSRLTVRDTGAMEDPHVGQQTLLDTTSESCRVLEKRILPAPCTDGIIRGALARNQVYGMTVGSF